jgi:hypothetical protein
MAQAMRPRSSDPLRSISRTRRRVILRAIRHGEAVRDPQDAPLAVIAAERVADLSRRARRFRRWLLLHVAVLAILLVVFRYVEAVVLAVIGLAVIAVLLQRRVDEKARRAAEANRRLAAAFGLEIPEDPLAGDARSVASISLDVRPGVAAGVAAAVMIAVVAVAIVLRDPGELDTAAVQPIAGPSLSVWVGRVNSSCRAARRGLRDGGLHARNRVLGTMDTAIGAEAPPADEEERPSQAVDGLHRAVLLSEDAERWFHGGDLRTASRFLGQAHDWGLHAETLLQELGASSCAGLF